VTTGLHRYYGTRDLHFITGSCHWRQPHLGSAKRRDLFLKILEEARRRYRFVLHGYVIMPEHFHLLVTEPERGDPSLIMKVIKQRFTRKLRRKRTAIGQGSLWEEASERIWQKRFYDFNVWSERKRVEKLRYMHRNPVTRGLVERPEQWKWSSFRAYMYGEVGAVRVRFQEWPMELKKRPPRTFGQVEKNPLIRKKRE
jgi:putative transposase